MTATLLGKTTIYPTLEVSVAFTSTPGDTSTWTDITAYVRGLNIKRGRQDELGRVEAGTLQVVLSNSDRRFDPTYTSSPYYPYVLPMRQIRVRATWNSITYQLWRGYVETWPPSWPALGKDDVVTVTAVDAFKVLNLARIQQAFSEELTSTRITSALTSAGIASGDQNVGTGLHTLATSSTVTASALEIALGCAAAEDGLFFMSGGGTATFQGRAYRRTIESTARGTLGDSGSELPYVDLAASYDDTFLWNRAIATWSAGSGVTGGTEITTDTASTTTYGIRAVEMATELALAGEAAALSSIVTWRYGDPQLRFPRIVMVGASGTALWPHLLGAELSHRYLVRRRPSGGGTISQEVHVEGMEHQITVDRWVTAWNVSPADPSLSQWTLGTSTLGTNTYVGAS